MMIQKGTTQQHLKDHVEELRKHFKMMKQKMRNILIRNNKNKKQDYKDWQMRQKNQDKKLIIWIIEQRCQNNYKQIIDGLFENDQIAYQKRVGNQNVIVELIVFILIEKDNLLEEIKLLGKGQHVEVLAYIASHLSNQHVSRIMELLSKLREAVLNSLEVDEIKEQHNIRLYNKLSAEIRRNDSLSESDRLQQELDAHFQTQKQLLNLEFGQQLQDRNDQRQFILDKVEEVQQLLNENLDRIARWSVESG